MAPCLRLHVQAVWTRLCVNLVSTAERAKGQNPTKKHSFDIHLSNLVSSTFVTVRFQPL